MRLGILGSLLVVDDAGQEISIAATRQRTLLAVLLVRGNRIVPKEELAEIVWDGAPPTGALRTLRSYVTRLRHAVGPGLAARISSREPGYLCEVTEAELDVLCFEAFCRDADAARRTGDWGGVSASAVRAIALWRGTPLLDVPAQLLREEVVPRLEQRRLQVLEHRIEADLRLDRHDLLVPELQDLIARYPLRERFRAQLMLALAGTGRRAEALAAYRDARRTLVDELGIEPGAELREVQEKILAGGSTPPAQWDAAPGVTTEPTAAVVPRQLPAGLPHFAGRADQLKALTALLGRTEDDHRAVAISAIEGTAGVGKTALAVHWAHQHADLFPDGQLYLNLHGFDPSEPPVPAAVAVRRMLDALMAATGRIPAGTDAQLDLYRSLVADRRMLIILDNARDAEQVRPLLPGSVHCRVLVTSRNRLTSLVALDGAIPLRLDLLTYTEARELLAVRLGAELVTREQPAVDELIEACARLPLALNLAAAQAAARPTTPLGALAGELRDARTSLDVLSAGQGAADVRTVFSWSYHALGESAARLFCLLGVVPGPDIGALAAAGLAALDNDRTRHALDELASAHLLTEHAPGRYSLHDLLRSYAAEQAAHDVSIEDQTAALRRLLDFYLHTAYAADRVLYPFRDAIRLGPPVAGCVPDQPADLVAALRWFDTEHACLLATYKLAVQRGWHTPTWQLAWTLDTFHQRRNHIQDGLACWHAALAAAEQGEDLGIQGLVRERLGRACARAGRHDDALHHLRLALALAERTGDTVLQARTHTSMALTYELLDDMQQSLAQNNHALRLYRVIGQPAHEAATLNSVGWLQACLGRYDEARRACEQALVLGRPLGHRLAVAATLDSLGYIAHHTGRSAEAVDYYGQALAEFHAIGSAHVVGDIHAQLGDVHAALGHRSEASAAWRQALDIYQAQHRTADATRIQQKLDT